MRLAFIVSHPVQYYVPVYREIVRRMRLTADGMRSEEESGTTGVTVVRKDGGSVQETTNNQARISALKVFYTWRDAGAARDVKFQKDFAWDIPLMEGYDFEVVPNTSANPGTHHRKGLINPSLVERVKAWKPDAVHITGYNYVSHGRAIKELSRANIPVLFRGDSHLLDGRASWWKWQLKRCFLSQVYRWPSAFAYVGQANRDYYRAFGVPERKLFHVPHTIDVGRFSEPNEELEAKALAWRRELGISDDHFVFLYAAKLEPRKRPMELLEAFLRADLPKTTMLFVGSGELESALKARVLKSRQGSVVSSQEKPTEHCKLQTANSRGNVVFLEFQNQSAMPVVYRLGDALVLPSGYGETWGLAVNEAQACGRPALVSDCVGCARDIIREGENGVIFRTDDWEDFIEKIKKMTDGGWRSKRDVIRSSAWAFDTSRGVDALLAALA